MRGASGKASSASGLLGGGSADFRGESHLYFCRENEKRRGHRQTAVTRKNGGGGGGKYKDFLEIIVV